jgi:hypothetical protein
VKTGSRSAAAVAEPASNELPVGVQDLAAARLGTELVGLERSADDEPGVVHLRADRRHHCLALVEGPSGVISSGFTVADEDALALAESELEQRGFAVERLDAAQLRSRRVRSGSAERAQTAGAATGGVRAAPVTSTTACGTATGR